jgi:phosphomannomutase
MSQRLRLIRQQWEGVYTADFTLDGVQRRGYQLAQTLLAHKWSCLVAHDTRFMGGQFARYLYRSLETQNVSVLFCPNPAPFPSVELALEQRKADTALLISAGNRPFWYNGMIMIAPPTDRPLLHIDPATPAFDDPAVQFPSPQLDTTDRTQIDLRAPYLVALRDAIDIDLIRRATLTVFVDPMNGTTSGYIPAAIGEGGQTKAIEINRETDPLFGRQPPLPSEAGLNRLRKLVKESDSHLGVALSADGRAISVADNTGELVAPHDLALLLADYLSGEYRQRGAVIVPQPADGTDLTGLRNWEMASGLRIEVVANSAARIAELLGQDRNGLLVGATAHGEVTLGRFGTSPDATLVALLLIEITARFGSRLRTLLEDAKKRKT